jgi:hypothetical protein
MMQIRSWLESARIDMVLKPRSSAKSWLSTPALPDGALCRGFCGYENATWHLKDCGYAGLFPSPLP